MHHTEKDKLKAGADNKSAVDPGITDEVANTAATGAVLPDPEEIKLPRFHQPEEQRTVMDGGKPKENNTNDDSVEQAAFDYRRNK